MIRLLPDIEIQGHIISIQYPFTLNGRLIKEVYLYANNHDRYLEEYNLLNFSTDTICFRNDMDRFVYIPKDEFEAKVNHFMREYTRQYGWRYYDDAGTHEIEFHGMTELYECLRYQCECSDLNRLIHRLEEQHRAGEYIGVNRFHAEPFEISFDDDIRFRNAYIHNISTSNIRINFESRQNSESYIHEYNYMPNYIKHYMENEDPATTLLLGVEIEVGGNMSITSLDKNIKNEDVKKCIQIMNDSESDEETLIYSTSDSTVQIELDTMPCSLEFHKQKMRYKELFEYLDSRGYKGHDCSSAGLHIHANREYLGSSPLVQQLTISKILYILEKFNDEICVIARRSNGYSMFVGKQKDEDSVVELYHKYKDAGKHVALNLKHPDTIEFRMFKSTLKYETFILTLEFVKSIIDYAKHINIEEIETMTWEDLMLYSTPTVREYYEQRKKKEEAKELKNIKEDLIKTLKKQISDMKTRINHCINYLEKKSLQKELDDMQKTLKTYERGEISSEQLRATRGHRAQMMLIDDNVNRNGTLFNLDMLAASVGQQVNN